MHKVPSTPPYGYHKKTPTKETGSTGKWPPAQ
jgi:hypothetical protein